MANPPAALTLVEIQRQALVEDVGASLAWAHLQWVNSLRMSRDPDDWRKYMEFSAKVTDPPKQVDSNSHLATFNFVFHNGQMSATITPPTVVEEVKPPAIEAASEPTELAPPPLSQSELHAKVDGMLDDLDRMLSAT